MKQFVNFTNPEKAALLEEMGFNCVIQCFGEMIVYAFLKTDKLHKALKDKSKFSKRDYFYDYKLRL